MNRERKALEKTYRDTCIIYGFKKVKSGSVTKTEKVVLFKNVKCALSQTHLSPTSQSIPDNQIDYDAKLFINPDIIINPGSEIHINRLGTIYPFISSGEPFLYESHQEIKLKRSDKA